MSTTIDGNKTVLRVRRRPKTTSSKAKTSRVPFGDQPTKALSIPVVFDKYNFNMLQVDEFDHMASSNDGLRAVRRGGYQSIEHWLLRVVLVNTYLLALHSDIEGPRNVKFRSQQDFRIHIIDALLRKAQASELSKKRTISHMSQDADNEPVRTHQQVKMGSRKDCVCYKGLRHRDRPQKRVALAEIAVNKRRESKRTCTSFGYKQYDVVIYRNSSC
jgi:hypothetical protein